MAIILVGSSVAVAIFATAVIANRDARGLFAWSAVSLALSASVSLLADPSQASGAVVFVAGLVGTVAFLGGLIELT